MRPVKLIKPMVILDIIGFLRYCDIVIISDDYLKNNGMSLARKFAYNSFVQIVGKSLSIFLGLLSVALIARYLGVSGFGRYTVLTNFLGIFAVLADLGLTMVTAQLINERPTERSRILNNLFGFRLFTASLIILSGLLIAGLLPYYRALWSILLVLSLSYFFIALNQVLVGLLQSELKTDYLMIAEVVGRLFWLFGLLISQRFGWGLLGVAAATGLSGLINFGLAWYWAGKVIKIKLAYDPVIWRDIAQRSWPLAVTIILNLLYLRADILLLNWFQGESVVGLYGAAYKVIDVLTSLPFLIVGLLLPLLTRAWANRQQQYFNSLIDSALSVLLMAVLPIIIGGQLLSGPIINLIAGSEFAAAGPILALLLLAIAGIFISCLFNHILIAINRQKIMVWPYLAVAVTAVPAYLILIERFSYWGAAAVTVYSELLIAWLAAYKSKKLINWRWPWSITYKVVIANLLMAVIIWPLRHWAGQGSIQLLIIIGLAVLIYGLSLLILRAFDWRRWLTILRPSVDRLK